MHRRAFSWMSVWFGDSLAISGLLVADRQAYRLSGAGLTEGAVTQAIALSQEKYCSVAATVRGVADITTAFEIVSAGPGRTGG